MLQGSPSRCNWGILWDSLIIRWDRSICWIIRVVVKGSFGILRDSWGILEEFLRNLLEIGDWKLIKPFSPACDGILEGFMKIFNCFSTFFFFLSFSFTSSFCAFTSAVVEFYLFIFFSVAIRTSLTEILWWFFMGILCGTNQTRPASKFLLHFDLIIAPHCLYYLWHGRHAVITRQRLI